MSRLAGGVMRMADFSQPRLVWKLDNPMVMTIVLMRVRMGQLAFSSLVLVTMIDALTMDMQMLMRLNNTLTVTGAG